MCFGNVVTDKKEPGLRARYYFPRLQKLCSHSSYTNFENVCGMIWRTDLFSSIAIWKLTSFYIVRFYWRWLNGSRPRENLVPSAELFSSEVGVTSDSATLLVIDKESFELVTLASCFLPLCRCRHQNPYSQAPSDVDTDRWMEYFPIPMLLW